MARQYDAARIYLRGKDRPEFLRGCGLPAGMSMLLAGDRPNNFWSAAAKQMRSCRFGRSAPLFELSLACRESLASTKAVASLRSATALQKTSARQSHGEII